MWPYFVMAFAAAAIIKAGTILEHRFSEKWAKMITAGSYSIAGAIFCFFAAARASSVGIDTELYGLPSFEEALSLSFLDFYAAGTFSTWDPLIKIIFWTSANATHSFFWYLLIVQLLFVVPTFVAMRMLLKDMGYMGMFVFGVLLFPTSLCFMRQAVAMGCVLLSYAFIRNRKLFPFVLCIVVAALFHSTALVGFLLYPLYRIGASDKGSLALKTGIAVAAVGAIILVLPIVFDAISAYSGRYESYTSGAYEREAGPIKVGPLKIGAGSVLLCICLGLLYLYCRKRSDDHARRSPELSGLAFVVFFGVAIMFTGVISSPLFRLGLYFTPLAIPLIPMAICRVGNRTMRLAFMIISVVLLCGYSFGYYVLGNNINGVYPYLLA